MHMARTELWENCLYPKRHYTIEKLSSWSNVYLQNLRIRIWGNSWSRKVKIESIFIDWVKKKILSFQPHHQTAIYSYDCHLMLWVVVECPFSKTLDIDRMRIVYIKISWDIIWLFRSLFNAKVYQHLKIKPIPESNWIIYDWLWSSEQM